jgi:hypothetical protein
VPAALNPQSKDHESFFQCVTATTEHAAWIMSLFEGIAGRQFVERHGDDQQV